ncbi:hypothetical protein HDV06_003046 [Boothiomyces sp. JEL0866]|nr:hypothetical protein HDV06_003046 [Boothiomyces sp. JEL0866]
MQVQMNPIGGQSDPREQERRLKLQEERSRDMKEFLAAQAAMAHPRLKRLLKNRDEPEGQPSPPIQIQHPKMGISSNSNTALPSVPPNAEKLPAIQHTSALNPNSYYNPQPSYQPYAGPQIPNYGMYPDPRVNMAMPPPFYPVNWGYHNYQLPPPNNQPDPAFNLYGTYSRDPYRPKDSNHFPYNDRNESVRSESRNSSQNPNTSDRNFSSKKYQSKEQYAKDLGDRNLIVDRQIAEKAKQRQAEKQRQLEPEAGFEINNRRQSKPVKTRNQYNKYNNNFVHERAENPEFHERVLQQSRYLKDLDEQIRIKNEMLQRQKLLERREDSEMLGVKEFKNASPYSTGAPELVHHSRKQFPDQQAKLFHSEVFPTVTNRSPSLNQFSALPPIGGNALINNEYSPSRMMEQRNHNLSMNSSFPPSNLDFDKLINNKQANPPNAYDPTHTKYLRGAMQLEDMPAWQKEEFLAKEQMKQKNQRDIQMQIAEKERQKQIQLEQQKIEDEKERIRIETELNRMREQYKREQEEDRKKAELEKQENERIKKEKLEKERQAEKLLKEPLTKPKRVIRQQSPGNESLTFEPENENEFPVTQFRSNSPPLPAVLKKMKERNFVPEHTPEETPREPIQNTSNSPPIRSKHIESLKKQNEEQEQDRDLEKSPAIEYDNKEIQPLNNQEHRSSARVAKSEQNAMINSNHEILEQLAAIQRELESENNKVRQDMTQEDKTQAKQLQDDPLLSRVENMEKDIERIKSRSSARKLHTPYEPLDPPKRNSVSSKYRKLKTPVAISVPKELFATETQIMDISNNLNLNSDIFLNSNDYSVQEEDDFNIEEIEQRNEARLRKINQRTKTPKLNDKELLDNFMNGPKKTSIFSKLKKLTGSQPLSSTSTEELSSKATVKQKKKTSLTSLNRNDSKNDDSASNSQIITKSQPLLASDIQKTKSGLVSSLHSLDINQTGTGSLHQIAEEPKSAAGIANSPSASRSPKIEQKTNNSKVTQVEEIKNQVVSSSGSSNGSLKNQAGNSNGITQKDSPLQMRKTEEKPTINSIPRDSVSSTRESVKIAHIKNLSPPTVKDQPLSPTPQTNASPINSARPSKTEKTLANEKLAERAAANELAKIVTQNINSSSIKSPDSAKIASAIGSHTPKSPLAQAISFDADSILSPSSLQSPERVGSPLSEIHHKASKSEQWPSKSEGVTKPFLSQQNSANVSGINSPVRSMRFDSTGSQNTVNVRGRAESSSQPSSHAPVVNRGRADSSVHTVQQQMKMRNEMQRPRTDSNSQSFIPGHLKSESNSARSSVKAETPEDLLNRLRHAATQVKPAAQNSQQTMVDVTKNQSSSELGNFRKNSNAPPPKPTDLQAKPQSPFDKTPSGKNLVPNVPAKPVLPGKSSPAGSTTKLEASPSVKSMSPFANNVNTPEQSVYVPSAPSKTLESQLQSLRNRPHSSSFGNVPPKPKDSGLRNEAKGLTTINSVNNSVDGLNPGSGAQSIKSGKSSQPGSTKNSVDNLSSADKLNNEYAVEDNLHLVQCFKSEEDGLFKLSYGWYIEAYPDLKYNIWRRSLFEIMQSQRDFPLLIPEELMAILNDEQMLE